MAEKFELYNKAHPTTVLFLHTDKTIYTNNETIWFSAYLISRNGESLEAHDVLSVALIREDDHTEFLQSKYILESGSAAGSVSLPDSIGAGFYQLLAYTNMVDKNSNPIAVFRQEIIIRNLSGYSNSIVSKITDGELRNDSIYSRAEPNNNVTLHINDPVINDTLRFFISSAQNMQVKILVHNYQQAYTFFTVNTQSKEQEITIAVNKMPKGFAVISVMNNTGRLLTEQRFFAHHDDKINTSIQTDRSDYHAKEKVTVKLRLTDKNGAPVQGMVSVACVQATRIEDNAKQDIETSIYLDDELGSQPAWAKGNRLSDKANLESALRLKDFFRSKWQDLMNVSPLDTLRNDHSLLFKGSVTNPYDQPAKINILTVISDSSVKIVSTDNLGRFNLTREDLRVNYGRKIWMILTKKNSGDSKINVIDPYLAINKKLAEKTVFISRIVDRKTESDTAETLSGFGKNTTLTNVIVKSKNADHPFFERKDVRGFNANACGDYVCAMCGDLNCPLVFHDLTRAIKPIKGKIYFRVILNTHGQPVQRFHEEYKGCSLEEPNTNNVYFLPGICEPKIFYGADYDQPGSPGTQYLSTLFWSPTILVTSGEATFSFTTSDTKGKFNVVVQGLSTNDVLFGETSFMVK